ncbi:hypothetical protein EWW49_27945, partial [Pseudomonas syringae]
WTTLQTAGAEVRNLQVSEQARGQRIEGPETADNSEASEQSSVGLAQALEDTEATRASTTEANAAVGETVPPRRRAEAGPV